MVNFSDPTLWDPPNWHPDYGDVKAEFEHLRNLANRVLEQIPQLFVGLCVPEVGLMMLLITTANRQALAEVYSLRSDQGANQRKYGVFLYSDTPSEVEHYTTSDRKVIDLLKSGWSLPEVRP